MGPNIFGTADGGMDPLNARVSPEVIAARRSGSNCSSGEFFGRAS
jgi:hypothetical protein